MTDSATSSAAKNADSAEKVPAGRLAPWDVGELPDSPAGGWRRWMALLGPGVLLAGASIGSGEWLSGPAVSAQYGATLLWVATLSILGQVFCNLEMMRYTVYCGEPIMVGFFRTAPGPRFWIWAYLLLDFSSIWPFNAANAAVPLAAAFLGHLPGDTTVSLFWGAMTLSESGLVKGLGYMIFLGAFVPLIFGGTIYKMLERVMAAKLVIVLVFLLFVGVFMVSTTTAKEVLAGFVGFGEVPLRAETVVAGRHFQITEEHNGRVVTIKGTIESDRPQVTSFVVHGGSPDADFNINAVRAEMEKRAMELAVPGRFFVATERAGWADHGLTVEGRILEDRTWVAEHYAFTDDAGEHQFDRIEDVPPETGKRFSALVENKGLERTQFTSYLREHGRLPDLDWAMLATLAAIAGAGGMTNILFSNFAREKGWGMGKNVGAIPSAVGGRLIALSHVGMVFKLSDESRKKWRGWMRHITADQLVIWMLCSVIGMALPCMMSLEFIRNAPVSGDRVAAMTAEGMATRYPEFRESLWFLTLLIGFLVLAPGQILAGDQLARRWTDIIWTASPWAQKLEGNQVKYVYYAILILYGAWGLLALTFLDPIQVLKVAGVLMNLALGFSSLHTLYVNRTLLPTELKPNLFMQAGLVFCGLFFIGISGIVLSTLL